MFTGFTPETIDFLWGIRMNNNRDWFQANKKQYTKYLYEPMKELGKELFEPFLDRPGNLLKVSRIYRDARMHPPEPYKESLWICIRQDVEWWAENPCLYFEINPDEVHYGFFIWKMRTSAMEEFRRHGGTVQAAQAHGRSPAGAVLCLEGPDRLCPQHPPRTGNVRPGAEGRGGGFL